MPPGVGSEARPASLTLWRAVEGQHVVSTMVLVDNQAEQQLLEDLLEAAKPAAPAAPSGLHYLLFTPFRYPPVAHGSRFRGLGDPGVFYGAEAVRTACAELGYWRWRFLMASPELPEIAPAAQTVFQAAVAGSSIDLRRPPFLARRTEWLDPVDYRACQTLAARARAASVAIIRYQSVRDPEAGGAAAVLTPTAFADLAPLVLETWFLGVTRERVWWIGEPGRGRSPTFEFGTAEWRRHLG